MNKIEADSTNTKDHVVNSLIEEAKKGQRDSWFSIIRGSLYKTEQFHIHQLLNSDIAVDFIKGMVYASRYDKNSMQQVDYIVCAFTNPIGIMDIKEMYNSDPKNFSENIKKELKEVVKEEVNNLIILVLSEGTYEMIVYDLVSATDGTIVVSPKPITQETGDILKAKIILQNKVVPDFFDIKDVEDPKLMAEAKKLKHLFEKDNLVFPRKSSFIKSLEEPKTEKTKTKKKKKKSKKEEKKSKASKITKL